jgi:hypothetical protein
MDLLIRLAQHYYSGTTTAVDKGSDGRKRGLSTYIQSSFEIDDNESEEQFATKHLKLDQVKLNMFDRNEKRAD